MRDGTERVRQLVAEIVPADELERSHQADVLAWLGGTQDIYRRAKPATPPKHLVSYVVLVDSSDLSVFLVDHILAGLWLPTGGHVEPGEDPTVTAGRETREEMGIDADFSIAGDRPVFITVTRTAGLDLGHTDVSLWYVIFGNPRQPIALDPAEFTGGRWWDCRRDRLGQPGAIRPAFRPFYPQAALNAQQVRSKIGSGHGP
jgi:8-oxo-dGTP pyrophosphatase MutT (NUDIX family)